MRTIYKVNDKQVDLNTYLLAEFNNTRNEVRKYSFERFLKKNPNVLKTATLMPDLNSARNYVISEWYKSKEYADYKQAYSNYSPEKEARQYAGCMIIFWIILTLACIIGIACQIK